VRIQTRQEILGTWKALVEHCWDGENWSWGGRSGRNSIGDAEQLLTILYPATTIDSLSLDDVNQTKDDVLAALRPLGGPLDIPRLLVRLTTEYMREYSDVDGNPTFAGSSYFGVSREDPSAGTAQALPRQHELDVVDSFSMSITLCLSALGFVQIFAVGRRGSVVQEIADLRRLTEVRLTAAMVGLLRSFTVRTFNPRDDSGQRLLGMLDKTGGPPERITGQLLEGLRETRAGLRRDVTIGLGEVGEELDQEDRLFECGWSWGVVQGAPMVEYLKDVVPLQPTGVAEARPYLYFSVIALDGIQDLFAVRTRVLGLLNDEQRRMSNALQLRFDLTRQ
jgi:hypothetical protein